MNSKELLKLINEIDFDHIDKVRGGKSSSKIAKKYLKDIIEDIKQSKRVFILEDSRSGRTSKESGGFDISTQHGIVEVSQRAGQVLVSDGRTVEMVDNMKLWKALMKTPARSNAFTITKDHFPPELMIPVGKKVAQGNYKQTGTNRGDSKDIQVDIQVTPTLKVLVDWAQGYRIVISPNGIRSNDYNLQFTKDELPPRMWEILWAAVKGYGQD
jgi:hypothetical protein